VVDGMHTQLCNGPFTTTPTAFVGPNDKGTPSCPVGARTQVPRAGVWLHPGEPLAETQRIVTQSGVALDAYVGTSNPPMHIYLLHNVEIDVGLGPNATVARAIDASIRYSPGAPDTRAALRCTTHTPPDQMPAPVRLRTTLHLHEAQITLAPPRPSDRPAVTPRTLWKNMGPKSAYMKYQVLLVRYSATVPATQGPNGYVPTDVDLLAWVVYATPLTPAVPGCAGWSINGYSAVNGKGIVDEGGEPGP
jgi:hypothetical protein